MSQLIIQGREVRRYDLFYVHFPEEVFTDGERIIRHSMQKGLRPGVICTPREGLITENTIVKVAPISTGGRKIVRYLQAIHLRDKSWIHFEQERPVPVGCIKNYIRSLSFEERKEMDMRQSIPSGQAETNFLLYQGFDFKNRVFDDQGNKFYIVTVRKDFGSKDVLIPDKMLGQYFAHEVVSRYRAMPDRLPELLDSLSGMKMIYEAMTKYELFPETFPEAGLEV